MISWVKLNNTLSLISALSNSCLILEHSTRHRERNITETMSATERLPTGEHTDSCVLFNTKLETSLFILTGDLQPIGTHIQ